MKKVVFGGSRKLGKLNTPIRNRADNIIAERYVVLVGDANGADRAMQEYLARKAYSQVVVFCAGTVCRNNVGKWETRFVLTDRSRRDFEHYAIRDKKMIEEADYGFMVWDGESKGTLNNIINLIEMHKPVLVYFSPKKEFLVIKTDHDLVSLLSLCDRMTIESLEKSLRLRGRIHSEQSRLNLTQG